MILVKIFKYYIKFVTVARYSGKHCSDSRAISLYLSLDAFRSTRSQRGRLRFARGLFFPCFSLTIPFLTRFGVHVRGVVDSELKGGGKYLAKCGYK